MKYQSLIGRSHSEHQYQWFIVGLSPTKRQYVSVQPAYRELWGRTVESAEVVDTLAIKERTNDTFTALAEKEGNGFEMEPEIGPLDTGEHLPCLRKNKNRRLPANLLGTFRQAQLFLLQQSISQHSRLQMHEYSSGTWKRGF